MAVEYSFAHVGLHCNDDAECMTAVEKFRVAFGFPSYDVGNSVIVAGPMELTRMPVRGTAGHIAIACSDVDEAVRDMQAKGFTLDETTLQRTPNGQIQSVYLKDTFGGFACHLIQKR